VICPLCSHCDTKVIDKREADAVSTRRRRECLGCHQRFTTYERVEQLDLMVAKHDGRRESFNPEKLRTGITLAAAKRPVATGEIDRIVQEVEAELRGAKTREVKAHDIGELVMPKLKALDHVAYIRFASVYRDFTDVRSFQSEVKELLHSGKKMVAETGSDQITNKISGDMR
jgi:transcriptional repressor NrdR